MVRRITGSNGVDSYFLYGPEGQRLAKDTADGKLTVYLSEVHELELDANDQATTRLTLPLGSAMTEILINDAGVNNRYLLLDHLGSPEVILDKNLVIVEQLSFDPWGKRRQEDWSPAEQTIASSTPTGFTGHEMDDETGLINMAARLYDPLLGRFLSADTMIPNPGNLQSFNRYSYVRNNPLRYVDPTGYEEDETNKAYQDNDDTTHAPSSDISPEGSFSYSDSNGNQIASGDLDINHDTGRATGTISIGGEEVSLDLSVDNDGDGTTISGTGVTGDGDQYSVTIGIDGNGNTTISHSYTPDFGGEGNDGDLGGTASQSSQPHEVETILKPTKASSYANQKPSLRTDPPLQNAYGIADLVMDAADYAIGAKGVTFLFGSVVSKKVGIRHTVNYIEGKIAGYISKRASKGALKQFGRSVGDLSSAANQAINKEGLTAAARALTKHASGQRVSGTFPKLSGGIAEQNKAAQQIVDDILGNSNSTFTNLSRGGLEVRAPSGRGMRYDSDGKFSGFLDPKR